MPYQPRSFATPTRFFLNGNSEDTIKATVDLRKDPNGCHDCRKQSGWTPNDRMVR